MEHLGKHALVTGGGTGIGLALCNRVCANHQGTIGVASELGAGTTIKIKLPRRHS